MSALLLALAVLVPYPVGDNDAVAACLIAQGWQGDPNDGLEIIYAPPRAIGECIAVTTMDVRYV